MLLFSSKSLKAVIAENKNMTRQEEELRSKEIEVVVLDDRGCQERMMRFSKGRTGK